MIRKPKQHSFWFYNALSTLFSPFAFFSLNGSQRCATVSSTVSVFPPWHLHMTLITVTPHDYDKLFYSKIWCMVRKEINRLINMMIIPILDVLQTVSFRCPSLGSTSVFHWIPVNISQPMNFGRLPQYDSDNTNKLDACPNWTPPTKRRQQNKCYFKNGRSDQIPQLENEPGGPLINSGKLHKRDQ